MQDSLGGSGKKPEQRQIGNLGGSWQKKLRQAFEARFGDSAEHLAPASYAAAGYENRQHLDEQASKERKAFRRRSSAADQGALLTSDLKSSTSKAKAQDDEETLRFAAYLGIDQQDDHLMWIAGVAPLPHLL
eukprot:3940282-Rhodomonas_salina.1